MSLFVIGDLHLSFGVPDKPMDIFGGWKNYQSILKDNWIKMINEQDTIVIAGDISWGMSLLQSKADFDFLNNLPGKKIILKGNHDYWWTTLKKMKAFFSENKFDTLNILHNNHYEYESYGICGTRGWVNMPGESSDAKVLAREVQRLETSIQSALKSEKEPIVFLHYPPIYNNAYNYDILEILHKYHIKQCYYGHIHGRKGHIYAFQGIYEDTHMYMISSDYLQFVPEKVL